MPVNQVTEESVWGREGASARTELKGSEAKLFGGPSRDMGATAALETAQGHVLQ